MNMNYSFVRKSEMAPYNSKDTLMQRRWSIDCSDSHFWYFLAEYFIYL